MASKITIKRSLTAAAPAGLSFGEMAFVQGSGLTANQLYVGISGGNPAWVGAQIGTTGTWTDNAAQTSLATQYAIEQRIGAKITASTTGVSSFNGVTGAVTGVSSFNGLTGAVSGVTTSAANTFTALQTFSADISVSGATFTGLISGATATFSKDITVNGIPIGRGGGVLATNTAIGVESLNVNATGGFNTGVGYRVFRENTTGSSNVAMGYAAFTSNNSGSNNVAVGESALYTNDIGSNNVGVGYQALSQITGSNNVGLGYNAGRYRGAGTDTNTTGTGGIYIGYQARGSGLAQTNEIVIGVEAVGRGSYTAVIGATLQSAAFIYGLLTLSDRLIATGATFTGNISAPNIVSSFNGATGTVTGVSSFNGLTGAVSGVGSIVAGTGISISGPTGAVTVNSTYVPTLATTGVTGVASFDSGDFAVSGAGAVTIKASGVGNAQLENPNITINGATIALGTTYNFKISEFSSASSAELAAKLSDTTGTTGGFVRAIGPTISAPVISSDTIKNSLGTVANIPTTGAMASLGAGDTFVLLAQGQTLTNKTLTSPAVTTSLTTTSTSFDLLNTTATTVNFAGGASSALNIGNVGGTATFAGSVIVNGDFTVQGNTTTLNTTTLNVEDFNITMGLTLTSAAQCTGAGIGIGVGTGITFAYDHSTSAGWLSSVNIDLASGKEYRIGGTRVLNSSALGSGITGSSLTQVGTITLGTWQGTAITDTYLGTISTALKVSNSATTATSANTASAIVARDASGGFTAGTITATLTGNASTATSATTATNATNITVASETSDSTCFITFVTDSTPGNLPAKVNSTLTYNAASGELSATLIDGGTF